MTHSQKKKIYRRRKSIREIFLDKKNLVRDIIVVSIIVGILILLMFNRFRLILKSNQSNLLQQSTIENVVNQEVIIPIIDTNDWQDYQNQWYGFKLKYPNDWKKPIFQKNNKNFKWEYQYQFRKKEVTKNNPYVGFNVIVYNTKKVREIKDMEEFSIIKNQELMVDGLCNETEKYFTENENYLAKELQISADDNCYKAAFLFSLTRDEYIFNIIPILTDNQEVPINFKRDAIDNFPEFFSVVSSFDLIDIKKSALVLAKPKITAPKPIAEVEKDDLGRSICKLKNDHPSKSHKGKGKHLDMECCLDPDEYPNPNCYYSENKYGKYL